MDRRGSIFIVNFLDRIQEKSWKGKLPRSQCFDEVLLMDPASKPKCRTNLTLRTRAEPGRVMWGCGVEGHQGYWNFSLEIDAEPGHPADGLPI